MEREPASLIEACRKGDRRALETLFRAEAPALERMIARLVGPGADIDDLMQSTLIAAMRALPAFRGEASVRTWLARIAVRLVQAELGRSRARRVIALVLVATSNESDDAKPPDEHADDKRRLEALYRHLEALGPKLRVAFLLHVCEGRSIAEVAALVGATRAATKSRVFLARRALIGRARRDPVLQDWIDAEEDSR